MEKEDIFNSYNLFRIPEVRTQSQGTNKRIVVGLIDCSGSMGSFWAAMVKFWNEKIAPITEFLITFHQTAKIEASTYLDSKLRTHGGGMTNILQAFKQLELKLKEVSEETEITVVFISDGEDTVNGENKLQREMLKLKGGQGRKIDFLCLGIQSGFPTKIAMHLRELYHTGDEMIPAVYLIEYASEKAFFNKFETMANSFKVSNSIRIEAGGDYMKEYPWQKNGEIDFKEGKWVMVHKEFPQVEVLYNEKEKKTFKITTLKELPLEDLVDCFRGWVQKIQLISMDVNIIDQVKKMAQETFEIMTSYTLQFESIHNIFIISENKLEKQSFKVRAMGLAVKNTGSRIKWFLDELAIIAKGVGIGHLNQYDAAKRLGIGTITGKYHQKALALKGITVKDFLEIRQEFTDVLKATVLSNKESKQECSIFTLQNQKEIFQEEGLAEGLEFCKTQYDLVETFPVVGYGLKVKRYDGSMINPWKVRCQSLAKTHKTIDSMYLAKNSNKYELSIGKDQKEEINAVLPLFDLEDGEMSALFNTRLFKLAVSFMVVQNIDTYHDEAYLALLATTYVFLLKQPESQWRNDLITAIYSSIKVTYGATPEFQKFIEQIEEDPYRLWTDKGKEDHLDIAKIMVIIFYISRDGRITQEKLDHLVDLALVHYCEKTYVENEFKIFRVADFSIQGESQLKEGQEMEEAEVEKQEQKYFKDIGKENLIKDDKELKVIVEAKAKQFLTEEGVKLILNDKIFKHEEEDRRVTYSQIENFYLMLKKVPLKTKEKEILFYFAHYLGGTDRENYLKSVSKDKAHLKKVVLEKMDITNLKNAQGKEVKKFKKGIEERLVEHFRATHFGIMPMTEGELKQECEKYNANFKGLQLNPRTGMLQNSCMSPNCLYHLKKMEQREFLDHLKLWHGAMPARFHMTVVNLLKEKKTPEEISNHLFKSRLVNFKKHKKNSDFVIEYIKKIESKLSH